MLIKQKQCYSFNFGTSKFTRCAPLAKTVPYLLLQDLYNVIVCMIMFQVYSNTTCDVITNLFTKICNNINTRSNTFNFFIPTCYMDVRKRFIIFLSPSIWNNLPVNIKQIKKSAYI